MSSKHLIASNSLPIKKFFLNYYLLSFLIITTVILWTFKDLSQTFYQQDEWRGMGEILSQGWQHITYGSSPLAVIFGSGRPLVRALGLLFFGNVPLDVFPLTVYVFSFHILNSFLVFLIVYRLSQKFPLSIIAALFFAVNSVHSQSVSWFGAAFGLMPSSFFILLSLYITTLYLKKKSLKYLVGAFITALISIFFKEDGLFLFLFIPLIVAITELFNRDKKSKIDFKKVIKSKYVKVSLLFILYLFLFVGYRYIHMIKMSQAASIPPVHVENVYANILTNVIVYPLSTFSLIYIPQEISLPLAEEFTKFYLPFIMANPSADLLIQNVILAVLAIFFAFLILMLIGCIYKREKDLRFLLIFTTLLFILSILPYVVIIRGFTYLEPRYYYITSLAAGIYLGSFSYLLYRIIPYKKISVLLVSCLLLLFFAMHFGVIREQMSTQVKISTERKSIINQLYTLKPTLTNSDNIFYITGDKTYTVPNNNLPFQQGVGYTLMVLYYKNGAIPNELLAEGFLWDMGTQGYKQVNGKGFGYYTSLDQLKKSLVQNNLSKQNVTALYYDSSKEILRDITDKLDLQ